MLLSPAAQKLIDELMPAVEAFVGIDQVEITAPTELRLVEDPPERP